MRVLYPLVLLYGLTLNLPGQVFQLQEEFGVPHPRQIVKFPAMGAPSTGYMIGPNGTEVPYQVMSTGEVAVDTSLAMNTRLTWELKTGRAPQKLEDNVVQVEINPNYYEVTNGLTGVRITRPENTHDTRLAPIQGILLRNGVWTATGPNYIRTINDWWPTNPWPANSATARIVEQGPLEVTIEVSYTYSRPDWGVGTSKFIPGGLGYYKSQITVQAGQPSITIEDDTDSDFEYSLNFYSGVTPDQARYRGHGSTAVEFGREADGRQYRSLDQRPPMDALVDLQYQDPAYSAYISGHYAGYRLIQKISAWDQWGDNSGFYWMLYNSAGGASAPIVGAFTSHAADALGAHNSGPGVYTKPDDGTGAREAGINFRSSRGGPDGTALPHVRIYWGIFTGTKGGDLGDPYQVQNISRQRNIHGGFNLTKISRWQTHYPDPPGGFGSLYMPASKILSMIQKVQTDYSYYQTLWASDPSSRVFLDMWRDPSGAQARSMLAEIKTTANSILDGLVNQDGVHQWPYSYWMGGLAMNSRAINITSLLSLPSGMLTTAERDNLKGIAAMFSYILWDDDFVPLSTFAVSGLNLGTANMPQQEVQFRNLYALMLANHPMMVTRAPAVQQLTSLSVGQQLNDSGAHQSSNGYVIASMGPLLDTMQQLQVAGTNLFQTEPRMPKFAEFFMNMLTPPEPRFGGVRKVVSIGDSSTQGSSLFGQMGTAFSLSNPALGSRLMESWRQSGKPVSDFHGISLMKIDDSIPSVSPALVSGAYPGSCSVLRNGFGGLNETAIWFVNGDFYSDHRHADHGSLSMYALGAPLSIDWGSFYEPHSGGPYMHSMVMPEAWVGASWSADSLSLDIGVSPWASVGQQAFERFENSARSVARFQTGNGTGWTRSVYSIFPNDSYPAIMITDNFDGPDAGLNKVFTMNLMATGPVQSTAGTITPIPRTFHSSGSPQELPSATPPVSLAPGASRFSFTGQWLIDWDLYSFSSQAQQALVGNWAHDWHPTTEEAQFSQANGGAAFEERQHILRMRSAVGFRTLVLPYKKGTARAGLNVTQAGANIAVTTGSEQLTLGDQFYSYSGNQQISLASFSASPVSFNGITISGGPAEVVLKNSQAIVTVHGAPGLRLITIPGSWGQNPAFTFSAGVYSVVYAGGDPVRVVLGQSPF